MKTLSHTSKLRLGSLLLAVCLALSVPIYAERDKALEEFLLTAEVVAMEDTKLGITKPKRVTLEKDGIRRDAVFKTHTTKFKITRGRSRIKQLNDADRYENDMAAYRLSLLMEMDNIPVTVIRTIDNTEGVLQLWVEDAIVRRDVYQDESALEPCDFKEQTNTMDVFDVLIHNDDRNVGNVLYVLENCKLWMIDHSRAFRVSSKVPVNLKDAKIVVSEANRLRLKFLNYDNLTNELSDYLEKYQITSILKRRDLLLEMAEAN